MWQVVLDIERLTKYNIGTVEKEGKMSRKLLT